MVKELTKKIMSLLLKRGVIADDGNSLDYYRLKVELAVGTFIAMFFVIFLSLFLNCFLEGLIFIALFVTIHRITGGYHFRDPEFRCVGISLCYVIVHFFMMYAPNVSIAVLIAVFSVDLLLVLLVCPTKYAQQSRRCNRKVCRKLFAAATLIVAAAACFVLRNFNSNVSPLIFYTVQTNIAYMILANVAIDIDRRHCQ